MSDTLVILGMHRSGTSLLAKYLENSGLHIGSDLLGADWSNPAGHYENRDFLAFHNQILSDHHLDYRVTSPVDWQFKEEHYNTARQLRKTYSEHSPWGWKDPRTCLFIDFWREILDDPKFIGIYRHYIPVIQSLLTRDYYTFRWRQFKLLRPFTLPWFRFFNPRETASMYLRVWITYNTGLLNDLEQHPDDHCMIPFEELSKNNCIPYDQIAQWGIRLQQVPTVQSGTQARHKIHFNIKPDPDLVKTADAIWNRLEHHSLASLRKK